MYIQSYVFVLSVQHWMIPVITINSNGHVQNIWMNLKQCVDDLKAYHNIIHSNVWNISASGSTETAKQHKQLGKKSDMQASWASIETAKQLMESLI